MRTAATSQDERTAMRSWWLTFYDVKVPTQSLFKHRVSEQAAFGDITHEKFHYHEQLVNGLIESRRKFGCRCSADCLLQVSVRCSVIELDSLDAAKIVVIASILRIRSGSGEVRF